MGLERAGRRGEEVCRVRMEGGWEEEEEEEEEGIWPASKAWERADCQVWMWAL